MTKIALISIDDLRYDCLSHTGKRLYSDTPNLDEFARDGTTYTNCYSVSSYTPAPHASMFTGLYPNRHWVKTFFYKLPENITTLAQVLGRRGYKTGAWVEHHTFLAQDLLRGFSEVVEPLENDTVNLYNHILNIPEDSFSFFHFFDVHKPYYYATGGTEKENDHYLDKMWEICLRNNIDKDELWSNGVEETKRLGGFDLFKPNMRELALYRALDYVLRKELRERDALLEEIIPLYVKGVNNFDRVKLSETLALLNDFDLVIITSDHGEGIVKRDFVNITGVSEAGLHVPMLLSEKIWNGKVDALVSPIDIAPTIYDFLGFKIKGLDGISLFNPDPERTIYADTWDYRGITDNFTLKETPTSDFLAAACAMYKDRKCTVEGGVFSGDMELKSALVKYLEGYK